MANITDAPQVGLSEFLSKVKGVGLMKTNRFGVMVNAPFNPSFSSGTQQGDFTNRDMFMFCDSAQIPGVNFATTQARTYGEYREMPYEKLFDTATLSFFVDNNMHVRRFWEEWTNQVQDPYTRHFNYYDQYAGTVIVYVYDVTNNNRYAIQLMEAYPKTVAAIQLENSSREAMKISVTMQYKYYRSSFFAEPTESQVSQSGAFVTNAGKISSQITAARAIPDSYMNAFDGFQEAFNSLSDGESIQNSLTNTFNNSIQTPSMDTLKDLINQTELPIMP